MNTPGPDQQYIGDGVYASFDGYQIILETRNGYQTTNRTAMRNTSRSSTRNREKTSTPADSWGQ